MQRGFGLTLQLLMSQISRTQMISMCRIADVLLQLAPLTVKEQGFQLAEEQAPALAREI